MKKLLIFGGCLIAGWANAQTTSPTRQKLNTFYIIDSVTKKPVITLVVIARANLTMTTENDGVFIIPGDLTKMRDTVILSAQGYNTTKLSLRNLIAIDTIRMNKKAMLKPSFDIKYTKDSLINDFSRFDVGYYAGVSTETARFDYLQLAQKFTLRRANVMLKTVDIIRLVYNNTDPSRTVQPTKYHLRVYDVDPKTGGPGQDLCSEIIEVSNGDDQQNKVNLKKYNIIIPGKSFFIAVEWMQDYYNAAYSIYTDLKTKKAVIVSAFKPAIAISPITGKEINIWALNTKTEWRRYTYFAPFGTDLGIKVNVEY